MAECYTMLKQDKDAIAILDGIPSRQRTPKVCSGRGLSLALAQKVEKKVEESKLLIYTH